jgi:hypothetical protein
VAHYFAIGAVSAALQGILLDARGPDVGNPAIEVAQVADFAKERPAETGVSILLYRTVVSPLPRTLTSRVPLGGRPKLPPLPVDLYYLLAPWAKSAVVEHRLLGWLMRSLEDNNTLNSGQLNYYAGPATVDGPSEIFTAGETVTLSPEPLPLQDLSFLTDLLKASPRICVAYLARMVHLESLVELPTGERVQVRDFDYAGVKS